MVLDASKVNNPPTFTIGKQDPFVFRIGSAEGKPVQSTNYAQYDTKTEPNYAQYDCYRSPDTSGAAGDGFDMMM
ncbi:MAG: hypothetical protein ACI4S3_03500 [Candidatus Gastranaerophilaceae bacterium]